jgi:hypothetical protein
LVKRLISPRSSLFLPVKGLFLPVPGAVFGSVIRQKDMSFQMVAKNKARRGGVRGTAK